MSSQFGEQASTEAPKRMGMVELNVELLSQLTINGLNNLSNGIQDMANVR